MTPDVDAAMGRALELAAAAQEWGDTPIGAVVLGPDGAVLAEAANEREKRGDPTAHAEVLALRAAAAGARRRLAADRRDAGGHPRAVHDVRRRERAGPGRPGGLRRRRPEGRAPSGRCGTSSATAGSTTGPR